MTNAIATSGYEEAHERERDDRADGYADCRAGAVQRPLTVSISTPALAASAPVIGGRDPGDPAGRWGSMRRRA